MCCFVDIMLHKRQCFVFMWLFDLSVYILLYDNDNEYLESIPIQAYKFQITTYKFQINKSSSEWRKFLRMNVTCFIITTIMDIQLNCCVSFSSMSSYIMRIVFLSSVQCGKYDSERHKKRPQTKENTNTHNNGIVYHPIQPKCAFWHCNVSGTNCGQFVWNF